MDKPLDPLSLEPPILVVAPHPDDETLGCGGLIALLTKARRAVQVVIVSDGSASHSRSESDKLATIRHQEAEAALDVLGVDPAMRHYWQVRDGAVPRINQPGFATLTARASELLEQNQIRTLIVPWRRDPHPDHIATSAIFRAAAHAVATSLNLLEYPVWAANRPRWGIAPLPGEVEHWRVDIGSVLECKRAAIRCYHSQRGLRVDGEIPALNLDERFKEVLEQPYEIFWQPLK